MNSPVIRNDSHSEYQQVKRQATVAMQAGIWIERFQPRFVPLAGREWRSDLPREAVDRISEGKNYLSYRGLPLAKDPFDMMLYEMLFFETKPRTVIELGAYTGASALWMADTLATLEIECRVCSADIDLSLVDELPRQHPGIEFRQGDCNRIEQLFPAAMLNNLPHPLIVIDDAHVNTTGVYQHFHQHAMQSGDYLIVEDTIPWIPGTFGESTSTSDWGDWKWREVREFFDGHEGAYLVDRYFTDFFGYNGTWNWNGFLRRT